MYLWQSLLVCFGSLSCIRTNPWPTSRLPDRSRDAAICCDSRCDSICLHLVQILNFGIGKSPSHTITEPSSCLTFGVIQGVAALSPFFTAHRPSYLIQRFQTDSSHQRTLFHGSISSLCALEPFDIVCFHNRGFSTVILLYRPVSLRLLLTVDVDIFFLHCFCCAVMFGAVSLLSR